MHDFKYVGDKLYCEKVPVERLARRFGTPLYVYSYGTIIDHFVKLKTAFREIDPLICYSVKANPSLAILRALVDVGAGLDIVSGGELYRARMAGADPSKIVYAGVGKTQPEIDAALKAGILLFNVESIEELKLIDRRAAALKKRPSIAVRVNPGIEAKTHKYITTGARYNKFGLDFNTAKWIFLNSGKFPNLKLRGVHIHIGSQIVEARPFVSAIKTTRDFLVSLKNLGVKMEYFNIGGGLGIIYRDERPQTAAGYARAVLPILEDTGLKIILEPGRFIAGNAGILVTSVTYVKKTKVKNFIIVDAGMNDLMRPALYEAYHDILPVVRVQGSGNRVQKKRFDVVGPICETGDFFALDRKMPEPGAGDALAIMGAGAYGFSMASNYNARRRPAEIMVIGSEFYEIRKRETNKDLISGEVIPQILR